MTTTKDSIQSTLYGNTGRQIARRFTRSWLERNSPDLLNAIDSHTSFLPDDAPLAERVFCVTHDITKFPACDICHVAKKQLVRDPVIRYSPYCSKECSYKDCSRKNKDMQASRTPEQKRAANEKRRLTTLAKTGYEYNSQRPEIKKILAKIQHDKLKYNVGDDAYNKLTKDWLYEEYSVKKRSSVDIGQEIGTTSDVILDWCRKFGIEINDGCVVSGDEIEIRDYVISLLEKDVEVRCNRRDIIPPLELDVYIPSLGVAIEYNGLPWHSEEFGKDSTYHLNKTLACNKIGIDLVHIMSLDWESNKDRMKMILKSILNGDIATLPPQSPGVVLVDRGLGIKYLRSYQVAGYEISGHLPPEAITWRPGSIYWTCGKTILKKTS